MAQRSVLVSYVHELGRVSVVILLMVVVSALSGCGVTSQTGSSTLDRADGSGDRDLARKVPLNRKADGYRGIWYMNQPLDNRYRFKYSGGLATYTAKHRPFAVYSKEAGKTFFTYGGTTEGFNENLELSAPGLADTTGGLLHMVSYYDHETDRVARPTLLLDKHTWDAHDNPVISLDEDGYIWIFSTSHGRSRPSYIHRSTGPYDISSFERVRATRLKDGRRVSINNFSYMQPWYVPGRGFFAFFTRYNYPANRTPVYMTSRDGVNWSAWQRIATIGEGHYQISAASRTKAATALNYHPSGQGVNWRTNLYYIETDDFGRTWQTAGGKSVDLPVTDVRNPALVRDYQSEGLLVYLKDIRFDAEDRPVILFVTSPGYASGPENDPRTWRTARWTGTEWQINAITTSDNNYDMGSLHLEEGGTWRVVAPTASGPQQYNPGGEVVTWISSDRGKTWRKQRQLTKHSERNHTYIRRPTNAHPEFYAFWADGNGREPSVSHLYYADSSGTVFRLPPKMNEESEKPVSVF